MKKYNFSGNKYVSIIGLVLTIVLSFSLIGFTIAFFSSGDFTSGFIGLSGAVNIEAVGLGDDSIENTESEGVITSKLLTHLDPAYGNGNYFLVPEAPLNIRANCKVYKSATHPLLRANISFVLTSPDHNTTVSDMSDIYFQLLLTNFKDVVSSENDDGEWIYYDNYFYFVQKNQSIASGNENQYILTEVNVSNDDRIVLFINDDYIYPIDNTNSSYAGYYLQIIITFEAIQNFIPNAKGERLANTIQNSLTVFSDLAPINTTP